MPEYTRGEFLGFGAVLGGAFALGRLPRRVSGFVQSASAAQPTVPAGGLKGEPDLIVVNARVFTSDASKPRAEAFAVKNGRFVAVGSTADLRNLASARTQVIDAEAKHR